MVRDSTAPAVQPFMERSTTPTFGFRFIKIALGRGNAGYCQLLPAPIGHFTETALERDGGLETERRDARNIRPPIPRVARGGRAIKSRPHFATERRQKVGGQFRDRDFTSGRKVVD